MSDLIDEEFEDWENDNNDSNQLNEPAPINQRVDQSTYQQPASVLSQPIINDDNESECSYENDLEAEEEISEIKQATFNESYQLSESTDLIDQSNDSNEFNRTNEFHRLDAFQQSDQSIHDRSNDDDQSKHDQSNGFDELNQSIEFNDQSHEFTQSNEAMESNKFNKSRESKQSSQQQQSAELNQSNEVNRSMNQSMNESMNPSTNESMDQSMIASLNSTANRPFLPVVEEEQVHSSTIDSIVESIHSHSPMFMNSPVISSTSIEEPVTDSEVSRAPPRIEQSPIAANQRIESNHSIGSTRFDAPNQSRPATATEQAATAIDPSPPLNSKRIKQARSIQLLQEFDPEYRPFERRSTDSSVNQSLNQSANKSPNSDQSFNQSLNNSTARQAINARPSTPPSNNHEHNSRSMNLSPNPIHSFVQPNQPTHVAPSFNVPPPAVNVNQASRFAESTNQSSAINSLDRSHLFPSPASMTKPTRAEFNGNQTGSIRMNQSINGLSSTKEGTFAATAPIPATIKPVALSVHESRRLAFLTAIARAARQLDETERFVNPTSDSASASDSLTRIDANQARLQPWSYNEANQLSLLDDDESDQQPRYDSRSSGEIDQFESDSFVSSQFDIAGKGADVVTIMLELRRELQEELNEIESQQ